MRFTRRLHTVCPSIHSLIFFAALWPKTGNVFWLGLGLFESSLTNGRITPNAHALAELAKKNRTGRAFSSLASGVMRRPASAYDGTVRFLLTTSDRDLPIALYRGRAKYYRDIYELILP